MGFIEPELEFDRDGPFHRLVVAYAAQSHGLLDLMARGVRNLFDGVATSSDAEAGPSRQQMVEQVCGGVLDGYQDHVRAVLDSENVPLLGVQRPGSVHGSGPLVDTSALADELVGDPMPPLAAFNDVTAGSLLVLAWESTEGAHSHDPLWEFLRHCRNAAAHGGRFAFLHGEPRRPAVWRELGISGALQDRPLFTTPAGDGFLGPGDALYLLADIEARFF